MGRKRGKSGASKPHGRVQRALSALDEFLTSKNTSKKERRMYGNVHNFPVVRPAASAAAETQLDPALAKIMMDANNQTSGRYDSIEAAMEGEHTFKYVDSYYGPLQVKNNNVGANKITTIDKAPVVMGAADIKPQIKVEITERIPAELFRSILSGFHWVNSQYHQEAAALIFRDPNALENGTNGYFVYYPKQRISGGSVTYLQDADAMGRLRNEYQLVCELHSHHTMGAFWSGTDDTNEQAVGFYVVIGTISSRPTYRCRAKYKSISQELRLEQVFGASDDELLDITALPEPPEDLKTAIDRSPATYTSGYGTGYHGRGYRGYDDEDDYYSGAYGYSAYQGGHSYYSGGYHRPVDNSPKFVEGDFRADSASDILSFVELLGTLRVDTCLELISQWIKAKNTAKAMTASRLQSFIYDYYIPNGRQPIKVFGDSRNAMEVLIAQLDEEHVKHTLTVPEQDAELTEEQIKVRLHGTDEDETHGNPASTATYTISTLDFDLGRPVIIPKGHSQYIDSDDSRMTIRIGEGIFLVSEADFAEYCTDYHYAPITLSVTAGKRTDPIRIGKGATSYMMGMPTKDEGRPVIIPPNSPHYVGCGAAYMTVRIGNEIHVATPADYSSYMNEHRYYVQTR